MSTDSLGNTLAHHNGAAMESIITALYPGASFSSVSTVDLIIDGVKVEIKSCQEYTKDNSNSSGTRSGRFCFTDLQHQELLENAGEYIFLVHRGQIPFLFFRVPANCLNLGAFSGVKCVCWKTLIGGVIC